jgi:hypothetical protein
VTGDERFEQRSRSGKMRADEPPMQRASAAGWAGDHLPAPIDHDRGKRLLLEQHIL